MQSAPKKKDFTMFSFIYFKIYYQKYNKFVKIPIGFFILSFPSSKIISPRTYNISLDKIPQFIFLNYTSKFLIKYYNFRN